MRRPERGPIPVAKTPVDQNTDIDVLLRRIGEQGDSAATIEELVAAGLVTRTSTGEITAKTTIVNGPQNLYNFLKGYK